jgi:integrase
MLASVAPGLERSDSKRSAFDPKQRVPGTRASSSGRKAPLRLRELWAIRVRLQLSGSVRNLALFNLAIDSKLRGCDLVSLRVSDVSQGAVVSRRAIVLRGKTNRQVQFEITQQTRACLLAWIHSARLSLADYLFPGGHRHDALLSTRQYARIVHAWVRSIGFGPLQLRHPQHAAHQGGTQSAGRRKTYARYSCC